MMPATDNLALLRRRLESALGDFNAGRIGEAAAAYRDILNEIPDQPDALHMLGAIAFRMGRTELALQLYDEALKAVPAFALAWSNRGLILRTLGRLDEALQSARKAIACDPKLADGWDLAGQLLREKKLYDTALDHHIRACALNPNSANIQNNCAVIYITLGKLREAYDCACHSVQLDPSFGIGYLTLGNILGSAGWPDRAIPYYRKAATLDSSLGGQALGSEGRAHLLIGEMAEGWIRTDLRDYDIPRFAGLPRWKGEKVGHLFLYAEQGAGDIVHFMRYLPFLRDRADKITLEVPVAMRRFMQANVQGMDIITPDDPVPPVDALGFLMSLPRYSNTVIENIPANIPYIRVEEAWRAPWRERLAKRPSPRIGIAWMGNPLYPNDHNRSLGIADIRPLVTAAQAYLLSLQKGNVTATNANIGIEDADPMLNDFADTAGLIAELDLVIAADTSVAHFAGALGKPVWTLLPFAPDWRWLLGREDSPWYPTMRLFRQTSPRNWAPVIERVTAEVRKLVAGDKSVLPPTDWSGKILRNNPDALPLPEGPAL